jgi:predicted glycosyltransferase
MGELDPLLKALRQKGRTRVVLGLRDVIDAAPVVRQQWLRQRNFEALNRFYSEIWIYGDPDFYDPVSEYALGEDVRAKARFTGYLASGAGSTRRWRGARATPCSGATRGPTCSAPSAAGATARRSARPSQRRRFRPGIAAS